MSKTYFSTLNYSLANEDTTLEVRMVEKLKPDRIVSVCGSGGRALPLLSAGASHLTCVDLAAEQLHLATLRRATYAALGYRDFLLFWGFPPYSVENGYLERKRLFGTLELPAATRTWAEALYAEKKWESPLYDGKWERTFATIAKVLRTTAGPDFADIFDCESVEAQAEFYRSRHFPMKRWNALIAVIGNRAFFNALLYKGHFVKKNLPESHFAFYKSAFERIFTSTPLRRNFFIQLTFFGKIRFDEGLPVEADPEVFAALKKSVNGKSASTFETVQADITEFLGEPARGAKLFDFLSFSDVPSYFSDGLEKNYLQKVKPSLAPGAHVVLRHYMRVPESPDLTGYTEVTEEWAREIAREYTQMYRVQILRRDRD